MLCRARLLCPPVTLSATGDADIAAKRWRNAAGGVWKQSPPHAQLRLVPLEPGDGPGRMGPDGTQQGPLSPLARRGSGAPHSRAPHPRGNARRILLLSWRPYERTSGRVPHSGAAVPRLQQEADCFASLTSMVRPLGRAQCPPLASQTHARTRAHTHAHTCTHAHARQALGHVRRGRRALRPEGVHPAVERWP